MPICCIDDGKSINQKCKLNWSECYARRRYTDLCQIDGGRWRVRAVPIREDDLTRGGKWQVCLVENNISWGVT